MTRTPTKPLDDKAMWRKARRPHHPDVKGGDAEVFIWLTAVMESVCNRQTRHQSEATSHEDRHHSQRTGTSPNDSDRVPYPPYTDFREATLKALRYANAHQSGYGLLLQYLEDCYPLSHMWREQERGASYKRLAAIGHMVGMNVAQRSRWYDIARSIPLSDRHAGHILGCLKRQAA